MKTENLVQTTARLGRGVLLSLLVALPYTAGAEDTCDNKAAADIYARVELVRAELDLIRREVGKPYPGMLDLEVTGAKTQGVYYQVNTLLKKVRQLETESTFEFVRAPAPLPISQIDTAAILGELDETLLRVRNVKKLLEIPETPAKESFEGEISCSTVFRAIVQTNREVNELLHGHFSPNDVYPELEVAVKYAASLLDKYPEVAPMKDPPRFERGKRPVDVYGALLDVYALVRQTAAHMGSRSLDIHVHGLDEKGVTPSDVYDLTTLIVSELAFLATHIGIEAPIEDVEYPGVNKLPAHVYQLAKTLERQMQELEKQTAKNPDKITGNTTQQ